MGLEVISIKARILRSDRAVINTYPQNHQKSYSSCFSLARLCPPLFLCAILLCMQTKSSSCMSSLAVDASICKKKWRLYRIYDFAKKNSTKIVEA